MSDFVLNWCPYFVTAQTSFSTSWQIMAVHDFKKKELCALLMCQHVPKVATQYYDRRFCALTNFLVSNFHI